jgi:hypothetical protein
MSVITNVWQQLVQRRLWPLAILLLGALIATPMFLKKDPDPATTPSVPTLPATAHTDEAATAQPVVSLADAGAAKRRHVLGARKDPFAPAPTPTPTATPTPSAAGGQPTTGDASTGGGSAPTGTGSPVTPGYPFPTVPKKKKSYPADSLTVRFGEGDANLPKLTLETGHALPEAAEGQEADPVLVYLGTAKGGTEALFLLDDSVKAEGDGNCETDGSTACDTLHLRAGETEFLDVTDETGNATAQYELDLVAIHAKKSSGKAHSSKAHASKAHATAHAAAGPKAIAHSAMTGATGLAKLLASL